MPTRIHGRGPAMNKVNATPQRGIEAKKLRAKVAEATTWRHVLGDVPRLAAAAAPVRSSPTMVLETPALGARLTLTLTPPRGGRRERFPDVEAQAPACLYGVDLRAAPPAKQRRDPSDRAEAALPRGGS